MVTSQVIGKIEGRVHPTLPTIAGFGPCHLGPPDNDSAVCSLTFLPTVRSSCAAFALPDVDTAITNANTRCFKFNHPLLIGKITAPY
jgi:hypothetical protein